MNVGVELNKIWNEMRVYWFELVFGNANTLIAFAGMYFAFQVETKGVSAQVLFFFGVMFWYFGVHATDLVALVMQEELEEGTLEQVLTSRSGIFSVMLGRVLAQLVVDACKALPIFGLLFALTGLGRSLRDVSLLVLILGLFGLSFLAMVGVGATIAGVALVKKRVSSVGFATTNFILYLSGLTIPLDQLPGWVTVLARAFPMSWAGDVLTAHLANDRRAMALASLGLLMCSLLWVAVGGRVFAWGRTTALVRGTTAQY